MRIGAALVASLCVATLAFAANLPKLTGRVVDNAHLLSPATESGLASRLEKFQKETGHQLVIVTVPSLNGQEIEEFGVALGRAWGIGFKGDNDGALLIVAPNERRVRIEVGYGMEGALTDAASSQIIQSVILPEFKRGDMEAGIVAGEQAIESVMRGEPVIARGDTGDDLPPWAADAIFWYVMLQFASMGLLIVLRALFAVATLLRGGPTSPFAREPLRRRIPTGPVRTLLWFLFPFMMAQLFGRVTYGGYGGRYGGGGGSSSDGGGFSGGGGSFGGGGSTGRW